MRSSQQRYIMIGICANFLVMLSARKIDMVSFNYRQICRLAIKILKFKSLIIGIRLQD